MKESYGTNNNEYVSIFVVTYNSAATVIEALESVKNQTYPFLDIVISDDASSDATVEYINSWLTDNYQRFRNIKVNVASENQGISKNLNTGIRFCRTKWVHPLAGDDMLAPNCIEDNMAFVHKNDVQAGIVISYSWTFQDADGKRQYYPMRSYNRAYMEELDGKAPKEQFEMILREDVFPGAAAFLNKSAIDAVGGWDETIRDIDDGPMRLRLTKNGYPLVFNKVYTAFYRAGNSSISRETDCIYKLKHIRATKLCYQKVIYPYIPWYDFIYWVGAFFERLKWYIVINLLGNKNTKFNGRVNFVLNCFDIRKIKKNLYDFWEILKRKMHII